MNIVINIDPHRFGDFSKIAEYAKSIQDALKDAGVLVESAKVTRSTAPVNNAGPNERKYLQITGKGRMNHTDKSISREELAARYLRERGVVPFPIEESPEPEMMDADSHNDYFHSDEDNTEDVLT